MSSLSGDAFVEMAEKITTKDEFVAFLEELCINFDLHPEEWENRSLELFLRGLTGFAQNSQGYYDSVEATANLNQPSWRFFADLLLAARVYE